MQRSTGHISQMNARQSCVCEYDICECFFLFIFCLQISFYILVNLINDCETKIYLWISFYLICQNVEFLLMSLHLFVDHNLFIWNYATILSPYSKGFITPGKKRCQPRFKLQV